jgi:hypothetical protein
MCCLEAVAESFWRELIEARVGVSPVFCVVVELRPNDCVRGRAFRRGADTKPFDPQDEPALRVRVQSERTEAILKREDYEDIL